MLKNSGKWLVMVGVCGAVWVAWPAMSAEVKYVLGQTRVGQAAVKVSNTTLEFVKEPGSISTAEWKIPDENYSIYIPKILAKSRVIPNVDVGERKEYEWALKLGVAEAAGLSHPGHRGTTYLFAHSVGTRADFARYNAIFYLLHKLEAGDGIEVVYKGELFKYHVETKEVVAANELKYLTPQNEEERLVLQTCYPPGTTWKRLVVVAKRG
jgi:sortase A